MKKITLCFGLIWIASGAMAQFRLMGERNTSNTAGNESAIYSYASANALVNNVPTSSSYTQLDLGSSWHTSELAYDGKYRLFVETDTSAGAGAESAVYTYDNYDDLLAGNYSSWSYTFRNVISTAKTVGFEYDGDYLVMVEFKDTSWPAFSESHIYGYHTFEDLLADNWAYSLATPFDWPSDFHTSGIAYDGKYHLMGERATTAGAGAESFMTTFDSYGEFITNNWSAASYTQLNWNSTFHTAGITYEAVPEPATIAALGIGIAAVIRRRKSR